MNPIVRRILAVFIVGAVALYWLVIEPMRSDGADQESVGSSVTAREAEQCSPEVLCWAKNEPRRKAHQFRNGELDRSSRKLPMAIRRTLDRKYANKLKSGDDWWNTPCEGTGWYCGGRYCQLTEQFGTTSRCMDPGWYEEEDIDWSEVGKVTLECGGSAVLGFFGAKLDQAKFGWWGAGIGGGTCIYNKVAAKNGWYTVGKRRAARSRH